MLEIDAALLDEGLPLGLYRLMEKLGEGGMGEVWRARHQLLARPCAIKLIRPELLGREQPARRRSSASASKPRTIARLSSPNTVRLYDFGVSETGSFYFVMELLNGMDLASLVHRFGPLPPERVVAVLRQACRSLGEAHAAGLLHRDIKPHNLFLCRLGLDFDVVKVLDFGLVKSLDEGATELTAAGILTGTPGLHAARARAGRDRRRAFRPLLARLRRLLDADRAAGVHRRADGRDDAPCPDRTAASVDVPGAPIPERLEQIVLACLEKAPEKRPPSAIDLWRQLGEVPLTDAVDAASAPSAGGASICRTFRRRRPPAMAAAN